MDPQPAFSNRVSFQPLADTLQLEDPRIAIPDGVLQPDPPETTSLDDNTDAEVQPTPAEQDHASEASGSERKWSLAFIASLLFHAAIAAMLIVAPESILPPRPLTDIEGAKDRNPLLFGNDEAGATAAGRQPQVTDVTVVPESELPPQQMQPKTPAPAKPPQPPKEEVQPAEEREQRQSAEPSPEILARPERRSEKESVPPLDGSPSAKLEILRPAMPEPSEAERQLAEQEQQPAPTTQRTPQSVSGSGGQAEVDALRGVNEGQEDGDSTISGVNTAQTEAGNAAASNYRGLVQTKLNRASRRVSQAAQAKAHNNAVVGFVTTADGRVRDVRLVRSSGSAELDKFAVALVKGVAPYPPIPPETGLKTWSFTVQIGPFL